MNNLTNRLAGRAPLLPGKQRGAMTMFSAVLILILLTELVLYATQVGVFEQRKSANDMRQKQAFHAAEAGLQNAKEFFLANVQFLSYPGDNGWLNEDSLRWTACDADLAADPNHPCSGETFPRSPAADFTAILDGTYFYNFEDPLNAQTDNSLLPIDTAADAGTDPDLLDRLAPLGERVEVQALLCVLDIDRTAVAPQPAVQGCVPHGAAVEGEHIYFMLTLLAKGQAACADPGDPATCEAEALIAEKLGSFGPAAGDGGPGVPLVSRTSVPASGTAELVPNPDGGGPGVPISAWVNGRGVDDLCPGDEAPWDPSSGSWSTCERHEWYGVDQMTEDYACPTATCSCGTDERRISYSEGGEQIVGIDIVVDPLFPCDLFKSTFGVEKSADAFNELKGSIGTEIDDCSILDENSAGVYWMTGDTCSIASNTVIGSAEFPVFLISAAETTRVNGGASIFGVVFVTDVLNADATFESTGTNTIYGAVVVDAELGSFSGTFQIVYVDAIAELASQSGGIGKVTGGWTDFHPVWQGRAES
jgi:hypothetical protein